MAQPIDDNFADEGNVVSAPPSEAAQREVDELFARLAKLGRAYRLAKVRIIERDVLVHSPNSLVGDAQEGIPKSDG